MRRSMIIAATVAALAGHAAAAATDWQEHGRLETSRNGHFIQHADGAPFLWVGDTAWGMMSQLTREHVDTYLDDRKSKGLP